MHVGRQILELHDDQSIHLHRRPRSGGPCMTYGSWKAPSSRLIESCDGPHAFCFSTAVGGKANI